MASKEHLLYMMKTNQSVLKSLIDDITEEESMVRGKDNQNHIRWQTGHLIYCNRYSLSLINSDESWDETVGENFGGGSELSEDPSVYPPMAELKTELYDLYSKLISTLENITDDTLDKEIESGEKTKPIWQTIAFLCMHEFYHAGQITHIRKVLGRDRPFG